MIPQFKKDLYNILAVVHHQDAYAWKIILIFIFQQEIQYVKNVTILAGTVQHQVPFIVLLALRMLIITGIKLFKQMAVAVAYRLILIIMV